MSFMSAFLTHDRYSSKHHVTERHWCPRAHLSADLSRRTRPARHPVGRGLSAEKCSRVFRKKRTKYKGLILDEPINRNGIWADLLQPVRYLSLSSLKCASVNFLHSENYFFYCISTKYVLSLGCKTNSIMAQIEQRPNYCDFTTDLRYVKSGNKFLLLIEKLIEGRPINT